MNSAMMPAAVALFRWQPCREALVAAGAGLVLVALSGAMIPLRAHPIAITIVRDCFQVFLVGILFPLIVIGKSDASFSTFGLHLRRWRTFLLINLVLAGGLLFQFLRESPPPPGFHWDALAYWRASYVLLVLVFEVLFFYAYLRTMMERAFGIVPAIAIVALLYALHHVGFQPEYTKLLFVGALYATVFRLGNSALLIFPFFLGVGGIYDVLIQSREVAPILYPEARTVLLSVLIALALTWNWRSKRTRVHGA